MAVSESIAQVCQGMWVYLHRRLCRISESEVTLDTGNDKNIINLINNFVLQLSYLSCDWLSKRCNGLHALFTKVTIFTWYFRTKHAKHMGIRHDLAHSHRSSAIFIHRVEPRSSYFLGKMF